MTTEYKFHLEQRINAVARGRTIPGTEIYWDESDPDNIGPAYRDGIESGPLDFNGWDGPTDGTENDTYSLAAYFVLNNAYRGPDQHDVYPTFSM
jgi:hypothetical protein